MIELYILERLSLFGLGVGVLKLMRHKRNWDLDGRGHHIKESDLNAWVSVQTVMGTCINPDILKVPESQSSTVVTCLYLGMIMTWAFWPSLRSLNPRPEWGYREVSFFFNNRKRFIPLLYWIILLSSWSNCEIHFQSSLACIILGFTWQRKEGSTVRDLGGN